MRTTMNGGDWLRLLGLSALWGSSFLFYKVLGAELPPLTVVFGRVAIGAAVLWLALRLRGVPVHLPRREWGRFLVLGALTAAPFALFVMGERHVASGTAAILNATTPLFVALTAAYVYRSERMTRAKILGIACGLGGVIVLVGPHALLGQDLLGQAACLLAAVCYGFNLPYGRRVVGVDPAGMALGQLLAASLLLLPLVPLERPWTLAMPSLAAVGSLLGIAVLCTSFAYLLFFDILARAGAGNLSLVTLLVPVSALLLGAAVLGEPVTPASLAGMALIGLGLLASDGRLLRLARGAVAVRRQAG